ncbi:MAG: nucleotide exchange factor GrpE [Actinobacteria bacterium]|nr:nucleotide exchange factor GrpE [Actinomycetota bacterium]
MSDELDVPLGRQSRPSDDQFPGDSVAEPAPVPLAEEPPAGGKRDLDAVLDKLTETVQGLRDDFQHSTQTNDHNRVLIDKLHTENELLRRAELERTQDPVVRDLISLADTCLRNGRAWLERESVTPADIERVLRDVAGDVELILERQGVEAFEHETGAKFDRRVARAVRLSRTADASLDGAVAAVLKPGYRIGDRVLRYCDVAVWTLDLAVPAADAGGTADGEPNE